MKRKIIAAVTAGLMIASSAVTAFARYPDVSYKHWAYWYIEEISDLGGFKGYEDGKFNPESSITNAEFIKSVIGLTIGELENGTNHWADTYMAKAVESGIAEADEFADYDAEITRQNMAKVIARAMTKLLNEEEISETEKYTEIITDWSTTCEMCKPYIAQAYAKGIINGYEDGSFGGTKTATRAEASAMLIRLMNADKRVTPKADIVGEETEPFLLTEGNITEENLSKFVTVENRTNLNIIKWDEKKQEWYTTYNNDIVSEYINRYGLYTLKAQLERPVTKLYWNDPDRPAAIPGDTFVAEDGTEYVLEATTYEGEYGTYQVLGVGLPIAIDLGRMTSVDTGLNPVKSYTITGEKPATQGFFGYTLDGSGIGGQQYTVWAETGEGHTSGDWGIIFGFTKPKYQGTEDGQRDETGYWMWSEIGFPGWLFLPENDRYVLGEND